MFSLKKASTKTCRPWPRFEMLGEYFSGFFSVGSSRLLPPEDPDRRLDIDAVEAVGVR